MPGKTETYIMTDESGDRWTFHISVSSLEDVDTPHVMVVCNPSSNARMRQYDDPHRPTDCFQLPLQLVNMAMEHGVEPQTALSTLVGHQGPWPRLWPTKAPQGVLPPTNGAGIPLPTVVGKLALNLLTKGPS